MRPKILHFVGKSSYDGTNIFAVRLIEHLKDYNSFVIYAEKGNAEKEIKSKNISFNTLTISNRPVFVKKISGLFRLFFLIKNFQPDIIHFHSGGNLFLFTLFILKRKAKLIHHLHCGNINCKARIKRLRIYDKIILKLFKKYTCQIAVAEHVKIFYEKNVGKSDQLFLIPNSVPFYFKPKNKILLRAGYLGQISNEKRFEKFRNIIKAINNIDLEIKLIVQGDIYLNLDDYKYYSSKMELKNPSFNIFDFFTNIDLLFFTSDLMEGMPLVLLEAISFDVAVVCLKTNSTVEILEDYPLFIESYEFLQIKKKINKFYKLIDRGKLTRIHEDIYKKYSYTEMLNKIKGIYSQK